MELYQLQNVNTFETLNIKISIYDIVSILKTKKQDLVSNYNDAFLPYPKEMSPKSTSAKLQWCLFTDDHGISRKIQND